MADEPTAGEVSRQITAFQQSNRDDHERLRGSVAHKVDRDVYDADMRLWQDRWNGLKGDMKRQADADERERENAQKWRERRDANRKWYIAAIILPIGGIVVELINLLRSWH